MSNEIINRCCAKISLQEIFEGDVEASIVSLQESINSGEQWKALYLKVTKQMFSPLLYLPRYLIINVYEGCGGYGEEPAPLGI